MSLPPWASHFWGCWALWTPLTVNTELLPPHRLLHILNQACPLPPPGFCSCCSLSLEFPFPSCQSYSFSKLPLSWSTLQPLRRIKLSHLWAPPHLRAHFSLCSAAIVSCLCTCLLHWVPGDLEHPHLLSHLCIPGVQHRA